MNRLDVDYKADAPKSDKWIKFLNQLLSEEDVMTLQEYMGYLLIPSTRAQKMLMIIGNGGEGKSRIGRVLYELMGNNNIVNGSISVLDNGSKARFSRVKLVGKMCMLDDDMDISALEKTDFLKQLISSEILLEIEPKGRPSFLQNCIHELSHSEIVPCHPFMTEAEDSFADRLFSRQNLFPRTE